MLDSNQININFGRTLKELRTLKGLTQEKLAEYLGLDPHTITSIETGRAFVSGEVLAKLSNFFEVDSTIFFRRKVRVLNEDDLNYIQEIKRMLPGFDTARLRDIYNMLVVLQK